MIPALSPFRRTSALLLVLLLLPLQLLAPLLHAHAADDPLRLVSGGVHVPGLERLDQNHGHQPAFTQRSFPLVEEADLSRRDVADLGPPPAPGAQPVRPVRAAAASVPHGHPAPAGVAACPPPPSRAPPFSLQS